jgi:hypothetical protein
VGSARALEGRPDVSEQLYWLMERGAPVWAWPELVHPRSGGGCAGEGHHAASTAAVLDLVARLAVHEPGGGLDLLPAVPDAWLGQPVEAHGVPTSFGRLSYALRWHGERPALLWELEPHDDTAVGEAVAAAAGGFVLRAPGLDPSWQSTDLRGEVLLAAPGRLPSTAAEPEPDEAEGTPVELPGTAGRTPLDPGPEDGAGSFS